HSFWVVDFLYKKDMFPGHTTSFQITPTREGVYEGKCAELCGEYHSDMLFNVVVVSQEEFDAHMEELRAQGNDGQLGVDLNRNQEEWSMREKHDDAGPRVTEETSSTGTEGENERAPRPPQRRAPRRRRGSRTSGRRASAVSSSIF